MRQSLGAQFQFVLLINRPIGCLTICLHVDRITYRVIERLLSGLNHTSDTNSFHNFPSYFSTSNF